MMWKIVKKTLLVLLVVLGVAVTARIIQIQVEDTEVIPTGRVMNSLPEKLKSEIQGLSIEKIRESVELPERYDYREEGRAIPVRDQGNYGTCWAFAALTALETSLMPEEIYDFSRDHLNFQNTYQLSTEEGGSNIMSMAYLTGWQGPVLEKDDPYGDRRSPSGLLPVKHVQEARMPDVKDYLEIKQTVYLHGGVETSLYMDFNSPRELSDYYEKEFSSYCYNGNAAPNHDVVIIGWDDNYPAENFKKEVWGNGAFICQNSWGKAFGENGVFYVSYYDTHIGSYNVAYTRTEEPDNYRMLYQSDLCGWTGQIGFNSELGYFANVYEAQEDQELCAAGFYATGGDTTYRLAVIPEFEGAESLQEREYMQAGYFQYTGFYTEEFIEPVKVKKGQRFAVVVKIRTAESKYPIAVEFDSDGMGGAVTLDDGEGYISADGKNWERVEQTQNSNLCLKVYAK